MSFVRAAYLKSVDDVAARVLAKLERVDRRRSLLVGVSGIDASGKGFLTAKLSAHLGKRGVRVASINVDGWLNLPPVRFSLQRPAENFYLNALRLDEMFERLILPLKELRTHKLLADFAEETASSFRPHVYDFADVDVILLEGIFLFKRAYRKHFDLSFWIECSFETAMKRALRRAQEGLPPAETMGAYERIYFPAQRIHFERDEPRQSADFLVLNDSERSQGEEAYREKN